MNKQVILQLKKDGDPQAKRVTIDVTGGKWDSPAGGWLPCQSGVWEEPVEPGTYLKDSNKKIIAALLIGLAPKIVALNATGMASYPNDIDPNTPAATGHWTVFDTTTD